MQSIHVKCSPASFSVINASISLHLFLHSFQRNLPASSTAGKLNTHYMSLIDLDDKFPFREQKIAKYGKSTVQKMTASSNKLGLLHQGGQIKLNLVLIISQINKSYFEIKRVDITGKEFTL